MVCINISIPNNNWNVKRIKRTSVKYIYNINYVYAIKIITWKLINELSIQL